MATPTTPQNNIPQSAGAAPAGYLPTYGAAGIFTGYAPAPQGTQNVNVGGQSKTLPPAPNPQPTSPQAPTTQPVTTPQVTQAAPITTDTHGNPNSGGTEPLTNSQGTPNATATTATSNENYSVNTTDAKGNVTTQYYDANGNPLPGNPGGTVTQLPSPPTQGTPVSQQPNELNNTIQGQSQQNAQQLQDLNSQSDQAYSEYENKLSQIQNGTYPLTPTQQQLYTATQQQFDTLREQQMIANQALTQGTEVSEARNGETVSGAQTAIGNVGAAINTGLQKLSALDAQGGQALANLQSGFQKDDLSLIQDAYNAFTTYNTEKEKTLNDIYTATTAAEKDLRDFTYKQTQDNITNTLNSQKETFAEKDAAIKNQLAQSQLDEKTQADIRSEAIQQEVANNGRYEVVTNAVDGTQSIFDKSTGQVVGTPTGSVQNGQLQGSNAQGQPITAGNTGVPLLDSNTKTSVSGVPFIDGTNLTGKQAAAAQEDAAQIGIPYLGKAQATAIENADTARINMSNISQSLQGLLASNAVTRLAVGPTNLLSQAFQSNDQLASFNAYRSAAIEALRAMAGSTGLRINQAEILQSVNQDIPKITDTVGTANAKIAKVQSMLDSQERGLFGPQYDVMKAQSTSNPLQSFYNASPQDAQVITQLKTKFPNYSDDEVMQVVRGLGTNLYSSMGIQYNQ